jgi:hypothetical protein
VTVRRDGTPRALVFPFFVLLDGRGTVVARASGEQSPRDLDRLLARIPPTAR